jgi:hypothetical protein
MLLYVCAAYNLRPTCFFSPFLHTCVDYERGWRDICEYKEIIFVAYRGRTREQLLSLIVLGLGLNCRSLQPHVASICILVCEAKGVSHMYLLKKGTLLSRNMMVFFCIPLPSLACIRLIAIGLFGAAASPS